MATIASDPPVESTASANHSVQHETKSPDNDVFKLSAVNISSPLMSPPFTAILPNTTNNSQSDQLQQQQQQQPLSSAAIAAQALQAFEYIEQNEYRGNTEGLAMIDEMMPCTCQYDPDEPSSACGDHSDCINRMLFIECVDGECPVGQQFCQNRRFQRKEYAPIEIFLTEGKGYGIRARRSIPAHTFVIEYVGEVLSLAAFNKRAKVYSESGQRHFYFMALNKDELIDATKRGGVARFINHSCDPNCLLQKWVVGKHVRMGIFTKSAIREGEELTFDYKFERYGTIAQKCLCGTGKCKGTIGQQSKRATLLTADESESDYESAADEDDAEDRLKNADLKATLKRRQSAVGDDEEFEQRRKRISSLEMVPTFVKSLLRSSGKPRRVERLLDRLISTESPGILRRFIQLHGLSLLKRLLIDYRETAPILRKVFNAIQKMPISTRNTIEDVKIELVVERFTEHMDVIVSTISKKLLEDWSRLLAVFRIPKAAVVASNESNKRPSVNSIESMADCKRQRSNSISTEGESSRYLADKNYRRQSLEKNNSDSGHYKRYVPATVALSKSPRRLSNNSGVAPQQPSQQQLSSSSSSRQHQRLPAGWQSARTEEGERYYYNETTQEVQWEFPEGPPPPPPAATTTTPTMTLTTATGKTSTASTKVSQESLTGRAEDDSSAMYGKMEIVVSPTDIARVMERAQQRMEALQSEQVEREKQEREQKRQERKEREKLKQFEEKLKAKRKQAAEASGAPTGKSTKPSSSNSGKRSSGKPPSSATPFLARTGSEKSAGVVPSPVSSLHSPTGAAAAHPSTASSKDSKLPSATRATAKHKSRSPSAAAIVTPATSTDLSSSANIKKELREELSAVVVKYFSRYKDRFTNSEEFKKHARKLTHTVIGKESRNAAFTAVTEDVKRKVKKLIDNYAVKLTASSADNADDDKPAEAAVDS